MRDVIVAEVDSPERAILAARRVRELGYARIEAYTPFPVPELDEALAIRRTRLPFLVLLAGMAGAGVALFLQWWMNGIDYPIDVGGRPRASIPTAIPIVFETTVLFAAGAAFALVLLGAKLPRLHHPVFDLPGFERTSIDRFWIVVGDAFSADDDVLDEELAMLKDELHRIGAVVMRGRMELERR
ncbi:MAG: ABC-type Fe3+ transport system protein [Labilithrix sp.]|nr:ABC-type Fe3+ transport system protein [Labilithrix sp.]